MKEELSVEDLMKPRYLVVNNYPDCDKHKIFVGSIISFEFYDSETKQWYNDNGKSKYYDAYYDNYPHLFKKLEWYEEISFKIIESVKYLKSKKSLKVVQVERYSSLVGYMSGHRDCFVPIDSNEYIDLRSEWIPSSKEEYETYLSLNKNIK